MVGKNFEIRSTRADELSHVSFPVSGRHTRTAHCGAAITWDARATGKPLCPECAVARDEVLRMPWWRRVEWRKVLGFGTPDPGDSRVKHFCMTWFANLVFLVVMPLIVVLTLLGILVLIDLLVFGFQITPQVLWKYWLSD
ncbi:hypothetical protein AB0N21_31625 [Streptomyces sp. NPDC051080]|uniref:hypothetical protein n=1 Tax=Streptomyces sp. NPDC051080 TaxID=3157222 RepID=UPI0034402435